MSIANNENFKICSECGGKCCNHFPGGYIPSDFKPEQLTKEGLTELLSSGNFVADKFVDGDFQLDVRADKTKETVWLRPEEMAKLFGVNRPAIVKHISNIYNKQELEESTCSVLEQVQIEGNRQITRKIKIYNLDMIYFCWLSRKIL